MDFRKWIEKFSTDCRIKYGWTTTHDVYLSVVSQFLKRFHKCREPKEVPTDEIKSWILEAQSVNSRRHRLCALNAFYRMTIGMPLKTGKIPFPKKERRLPRIIDNELLRSKILAVPNIKHRALLAIGYCCMLRVSEVCNLKISDINGKQRLVLVRQGKGKKDRYVGISESTLEILREYFRAYKPKEYLFEGQSGGQYSVRSCEQIYHKYIDRKTSWHTLRHSGITSLVDAGANILSIQAAVGHNSPKTTGIYYHCSKKHLAGMPMPI